jgi:formylglycine-generating enzyme required for sulfatase activity
MKTANILWRDLLRQVRLFPLAAFLTALPLAAQVPSLINYQGRLTDGSGNAVTGNRTMAVRLYDAASGGNLTYAETIGTVAVTNGTYSFRFGSNGMVAVSANETVATTNGTNQIFNGTLLGTPLEGTLSLTDGTYSWTPTGGSSNSAAFWVTYNGTAKSFQVIYFTQVPLAGRAIVARYQKNEVNSIISFLGTGEPHLALVIGGVEESTRSRLLGVPYALKAKESEDTQTLRAQLVALGILPSSNGAMDSNFVFVQGGVLPQTSQIAGATVANFSISKYEVRWDEWQEVRAWAVANGYDLAQVGSGSALNHPVNQVSWFDVVKWCNSKSERDGLTPVYQESGGAIYRTGQFVPNINTSANGYRLPTEAEWEWAARGGASSQGYLYSGSDDFSTVTWYAGNSGGGTRVVGQKFANELGIFDMSGNVSEWSSDLYSSYYRRFRGGSWLDLAGSCSLAYRGSYYDPNTRSSYIGFRLARSSGQ